MRKWSKDEREEMYVDWLSRRPAIIFAFPDDLNEEASFPVEDAEVMQEAWKSTVRGLKESGILSKKTVWKDFRLLKYIKPARAKWAYRQKGMAEGWL